MDRCLALGGIAPPGAITVISSLTEITNMTNVKTFNFSQPDPNNVHPSLQLLLQSDFQKLATAAAIELSPTMLFKPADNSSYNLQFFGPAIRCNPPNSSDQELFYNLSQAYANDSGVINLEQYYRLNGSEIQPNGFLVYSAFSPQIWDWLIAEDKETGANDGGNLNAGYFFPLCGNNIFKLISACYLLDDQEIPVFYLIYLANEYLICTSSNASFEVYVEYVNGQ
jgi:hypothetical protein